MEGKVGMAVAAVVRADFFFFWFVAILFRIAAGLVVQQYSAIWLLA